MMQWETLILETIQMGGVLVFLEDQTGELDAWAQPLAALSGKVPYVRRKAADFLSGKFHTRPEDLIFVLPDQELVLAQLNPVLQGQRVLLQSTQASEIVDYAWPCDLAAWKQAFENIRASLTNMAALVPFSEGGGKPCLFLDRDDVVVKNVPYNRDPAKVELTEGIENLINQAHDKGYWVALVTNQSGLGRGLISWREYQEVHQQMLRLLAQKGCWIDESVWAGYYEQEAVPAGRRYAGLRKPRNGMLQMVHTKLMVDMKKSVMVGDSATDLVAAFGAGVGNLYLLATEKTDKELEFLKEYQSRHPQFQFQVAKSFEKIPLA